MSLSGEILLKITVPSSKIFNKAIPALCDVKISIFNGIDSLLYKFVNYTLPAIIVAINIKDLVITGQFGISTIPVSIVLINQMFEKANDLRTWYIKYFTNILFIVNLTKLSQLSI